MNRSLSYFDVINRDTPCEHGGLLNLSCDDNVRHGLLNSIVVATIE